MNDRFPPLGSDQAYFAAMLARFRQDPGAVDRGWRAYFEGIGELPGTAGAAAFNGQPGPVDGIDAQETARIAAAVASLIQAWRTRGHLAADWDPLGLSGSGTHPDLEPKTHGLMADDMDVAVSVFRSQGPEVTTPADVLDDLRAAYAGTLSAEFMHLDDPEPRIWMQDALETGYGALTAGRRRAALDRIIHVDAFENFMQIRFPGAKRFGMEGSESQLPLVERLLECAVADGVDEVIVGPMHRGRTTFMASFMKKPLAAIFSEFAGQPWYPDDPRIAGDVTYHMGHGGERSVDGKSVRLWMASHPSHVEAIIPVSQGVVRARQTLRGTGEARRTLGLMMHTDAGFAGQGVSYEALQLSRLAGYSTGGNIHVIANNQVGFTTRPEDARSSSWCSDPAKLIQAPVLRVNADDPDAAVRAADIAVAFNRKFGRDILIDLVCYRRRGHNELDEPRFTQPEAYAAVDTLETVREKYTRRLVDAGVVTRQDVDAMAAAHRERFDEGFEAAKTWRPNAPAAPGDGWQGLRQFASTEDSLSPATGVSADRLRQIAGYIAAIPDDFQCHPKLRSQLEDRRKSILEDTGVSWPSAEALAIGTLLQDGTPVRLTGQDTRRGTFSHRHAVLFDQQTGMPCMPVGAAGHTSLEIYDSPLSEEAAMAFEHGYAMANPHTLVMWEAQFGDFANGAQIVIDQFLAAGEAKWLSGSGLVLLLPHGLEGGGPEHSSARIERFLQLAARDNIQIVQPSTPANFFHVLRRQMARDFRKPLIVMTPKQMLRHKRAVSKIADFTDGAAFQPVLQDGVRAKATRLILCSGRVFYDLIERQEKVGNNTTAFLRIEELYPFPGAEISNILSSFNGNEVVWCQEEPENMGAWRWIAPKLEALLPKGATLRYAGRPESPSPSEGFKSHHDAAQRRVIDDAFAE